MRTAQQILKQTNELARTFAECDGWQTPVDFKFYEASPKPKRRKKTTTKSTGDKILLTVEMENFKTDTRARQYWRLACVAQEILTDTDIFDVLQELDLA